MGSIPSQYQNLPGYNTIYSESELRQAIALAEVFLLLSVSNSSSNTNTQLSFDRVLSSPDLTKTFNYTDAGTPDERITTIQYNSASLGIGFIETYTYSGSSGSYRVSGFSRNQK